MSDVAIWEKELLMERIDDDEELLKELIEYFNETVDEKIDELRLQIENKAWDKAERTAHTIKGMMANIGGERCRLTAFLIEEASRSSHPEKCEGYSAELFENIRELKDTLKNEGNTV